jgi:hypothetical protein
VVCAAVFTAAAGCSSSSQNPGGATGGTPGSAGAAGAPSGMPAGGTGGGTGGGAGVPAGGSGGASDQSPGGCVVPGGPPDTWLEIAPPPGVTNFKVTDVFAAGTNDLLFAGSTVDLTGATSPSNARLLRWTRGCWTVDLAFALTGSSPAPGSPSVHGTGPDDIWATAADVVYHRDAQGWTPFTDDGWRSLVAPASGFFGGVLEFNRVRAAAAGDFWITATSNILHWDGQVWTAYNFDDATLPLSGIAYDFTGIWFDSPTQISVVGPAKMVGNSMTGGFVHQFDGTSWTHTGVGVGPIYPAIWRGGALLWLAEQTHAPVNGQTQNTTLLAFDGTSVTGVAFAGQDPMQGPPPMSSLFGHGPDDIWAAGADVAHLSGGVWSLVTDAPAAARQLDQPSNTLVSGDAGSVWLVTPGPRFFRKTTGP